jgi:hypothetical protein
MNKDKLFSLIPKEVVKENEVNKKIVEQKALIIKGKEVVSQLSIKRYLGDNETMLDYDINERLNLFAILADYDFTINENLITTIDSKIYKDEVELDIDYFDAILYYDLGLRDMYELDNLYVEKLLQGKDIMKEEVDINGRKMSITEVLERFVFQSKDMPAGDAPKLTQMLKVKRYLLVSYMAEKNMESLLNGDREIYNLNVLL